jgi:DNA helicase-2/ATP-dependent DNA helicase PcrA
MTALRAKGKEFDTVILLDVNDGIWPNRNARTPAQKEAERRVFYVAFTRARKRLVMLVSSRLGNKAAIPSPFIFELGLSVSECRAEGGRTKL